MRQFWNEMRMRVYDWGRQTGLQESNQIKFGAEEWKKMWKTVTKVTHPNRIRNSIQFAEKISYARKICSFFPLFCDRLIAISFSYRVISVDVNYSLFFHSVQRATFFYSSSCASLFVCLSVCLPSFSYATRSRALLCFARPTRLQRIK